MQNLAEGKRGFNEEITWRVLLGKSIAVSMILKDMQAGNSQSLLICQAPELRRDVATPVVGRKVPENRERRETRKQLQRGRFAAL